MGRLHTFQENNTPHFKNIPVLEFLIFLCPFVEKGDLQTECRLVMSLFTALQLVHLVQHTKLKQFM
jgi:hypothetical protein